jgi:nucleoside-diphosphate-sugar epimerase
MKLLVAGSSGFVGRNFIKKKPHNVAFDHSSDVRHDITSKKSIINNSKTCEGIINFAGVTRVSDCDDDPIRCFNFNVNGTISIIEAAIENNHKWVGILSTGEINWVENNEIQSFHKINNLYGISKLTSEMVCQSLCTNNNLDYTIYRILSVVFGKGDNPKKVLPLFIYKLKNGETITINDSTLEWDFIHVDDVVDIIISSIYEKRETKVAPKEINIFSGNRLNLLMLSKIIHFLSNSTSIINYENTSTDKVTSSEYNSILKEGKISEKFIIQVKSLINNI